MRHDKFELQIKLSKRNIDIPTLNHAIVENPALTFRNRYDNPCASEDLMSVPTIHPVRKT